MSNSHLTGVVVCVTGGTGSFGTAMVRHLLESDVAQVRIFSRDEDKQDNLRNEIGDNRCKFFIGDIRNVDSVDKVIRGSDYVFHAAALKQVPSCEFFPEEAVATNVLGSKNVIESSLKHEVRSLVCLSTDKAVYPINTMGMTKALMERIAQASARSQPDSRTRIAVTRYGNVMMSRGSVIPRFIAQIQQGLPLTITNPEMTRFLMSLQDSIQLVEYAFLNAESGDLFVRKAPACTMDVLANAIWKLFGKNGTPEIQYIGTRHGEKVYESLLGSEEHSRSIDEDEYFRVPLDTRSLDYGSFFNKGVPKLNLNENTYNSSNTQQLDTQEVIDLLKELPQIQQQLVNWSN